MRHWLRNQLDRQVHGKWPILYFCLRLVPTLQHIADKIDGEQGPAFMLSIVVGRKGTSMALTQINVEPAQLPKDSAVTLDAWWVDKVNEIMPEVWDKLELLTEKP